MGILKTRPILLQNSLKNHFITKIVVKIVMKSKTFRIFASE